MANVGQETKRLIWSRSSPDSSVRVTSNPSRNLWSRTTPVAHTWCPFGRRNRSVTADPVTLGTKLSTKALSAVRSSMRQSRALPFASHRARKESSRSARFPV